MNPKGAFKFASQAIRSLRGENDIVCEAPTATCGPPGHPCETCMHLKGCIGARQYAEKDLCLIAPRSLVRPVRYKRYFNRGVAIPPYLPASKVTGQLKEVKMPEICSAEQISSQIMQHQQREIDRKFRALCSVRDMDISI
uniref:Uncharacterized protein n=1 Tax=Lygus hesperus TaxID=30085 RepID=A0A0K8TF66_LYGHE